MIFPGPASELNRRTCLNLVMVGTVYCQIGFETNLDALPLTLFSPCRRLARPSHSLSNHDNGGSSLHVVHHITPVRELSREARRVRTLFNLRMA